MMPNQLRIKTGMLNISLNPSRNQIIGFFKFLNVVLLYSCKEPIYLNKLLSTDLISKLSIVPSENFGIVLMIIG